MYSHELHNYLQSKNFILDWDEYLFATDTTKHPQIINIEYEAFNNQTFIQTNDGYSWIVHSKTKN